LNILTSIHASEISPWGASVWAMVKHGKNKHIKPNEKKRFMRGAEKSSMTFYNAGNAVNSTKTHHAL
jgi:hypothetical protein